MRLLVVAALVLAACGGASEPAPEPVAIGPDSDAIDATTIVGRAAPAWDVDGWIHAAPMTLAELRGKVVLVRWFTEGCHLCASTAPTLVALHDELAERGLAVIGLYHHKGRAPLVDDDVRALADRLGFVFPIAIDRDWRTLDRWWMDDHPDGYTSVSFLIDRAGVVRFVHTGGTYPPGSDDARQIRAWIDTLLAEGG